jgi:hypothetical protein
LKKIYNMLFLHFLNINIKRFIVENPSAQKLINKIQVDLFKKGFDAETLVADLKKLREYSLEENNPVLTKALRLTYEHIEANGAFLVPIPDDEPIEGEELVTDGSGTGTENNLESLEYIVSLFSDLTHKNNLSDLREYNKSLQEF